MWAACGEDGTGVNQTQRSVEFQNSANPEAASRVVSQPQKERLGWRKLPASSSLPSAIFQESLLTSRHHFQDG